MAFKFIITDGKLITGDVEFHFELLRGFNLKERVIVNGGGRYYRDEDDKKCYFYGSSQDFGKSTLNQFIDTLPGSEIMKTLDGYSIYFSSEEYLSKAIINGGTKIN